MTYPGRAEEPYTGPPPMVRPQAPPWPGPWAPGPWPGPWQGPWGPPPPYGWAPAPPPWAPPPYGWAPAPPPVAWAPPPGTPPHDEPQPYLLAMRSRDWRWWRPLLGLLLLGMVWTAAILLIVLAAVATGSAPDVELLDLIDPADLLLTNLTLIAAIPVVWLAWVAAHGMRPGWSSSVLARLRPRLFAPFTLYALAALGLGIGLSVLLVVAGGEAEATGPVPSFGWLLLVVFFTTPLQSAAEEYVFRGYLSQAIAGWIRAPGAGAVAAAVLTAALFSLAHAPGDWLTFLDRFAFGLAASAVTWLTGGLEAAIVLHAVNNVLVFVLAGAVGEGVATTEVPAGTGIFYVLLTLLAMGGYVLLVARSRGRLRPELRTPALDLRPALAGAVPPSPGASGMVFPGAATAPRHPWGMG